MIIGFSTYGQNFDFNNDLFKNGTFFNEDILINSKEFEMDKSFVFMDDLETEFSLDKAQFTLNRLSLQIAEEFAFNDIHNNFQDNFMNYCGPLTDGLYVPINGRDALLSNVFDNFLNKYLLPDLFKKK